jgi:hypothetical protein
LYLFNNRQKDAIFKNQITIMIDLKIVQEKYAAMADAQLIYFVRYDSHDLTDEALALLKQEFAKRGMNIDDFPSEKKIPAPEEETADLVSYASMHGLTGGLSYEQMIPPPGEESKENNEEMSAPGIEEELRQLINKCDTSMVINGIIFTIGSAVTLLTFMEGSGVIVAWGAILFGGIAFVRSFMAKKQCQAALKEIVLRKGQSQENGSL